MLTNYIPHLSALQLQFQIQREKNLTLNYDACNIPTAVYVNYKEMFTVMVSWQITFLKRSSTNLRSTHCTSFHRINTIKEINGECFLNTKVHQDKGYYSEFVPNGIKTKTSKTYTWKIVYMITHMWKHTRTCLHTHIHTTVLVVQSCPAGQLLCCCINKVWSKYTQRYFNGLFERDTVATNVCNHCHNILVVVLITGTTNPWDLSLSTDMDDNNFFTHCRMFGI